MEAITENSNQTKKRKLNQNNSGDKENQPVDNEISSTIVKTKNDNE